MKPIKPISGRRVGAFLVLALAASAVSAHHAGTAYEQGKRVELKGTVSKFEFVNPHAYVYFIVQDAKGGQLPWRCELSASATLARLGWTKSTFVVGQKVTFKDGISFGAKYGEQKEFFYEKGTIFNNAVSI